MNDKEKEDCKLQVPYDSKKLTICPSCIEVVNELAMQNLQDGEYICDTCHSIAHHGYVYWSMDKNRKTN